MFANSGRNASLQLKILCLSNMFDIDEVPEQEVVSKQARFAKQVMEHKKRQAFYLMVASNLIL